MPLTLEETNSLIAALGIKIAQDILLRKAQAEEFKNLHTRIVAEAAKKAADWHFKGDCDDTLARAVKAAGEQAFTNGLELLAQAEEILNRADPPPAAPSAPPPAAPPP